MSLNERPKPWTPVADLSVGRTETACEGRDAADPDRRNDDQPETATHEGMIEEDTMRNMSAIPSTLDIRILVCVFVLAGLSAPALKAVADSLRQGRRAIGMGRLGLWGTASDPLSGLRPDRRVDRMEHPFGQARALCASRGGPHPRCGERSTPMKLTKPATL